MFTTRRPVLRHESRDLAQDFQAADAADRFVGVRKMMADVALADRAEHGVGDGVSEHVGIAVAIEAVRMRDFHAAEDERAAFDEAMHVVADAGRDSYVPRDRCVRWRRRRRSCPGCPSRGVISNFPPAASTRSLPAATSHRLTDCSM